LIRGQKEEIISPNQLHKTLAVAAIHLKKLPLILYIILDNSVVLERI
jgi:hypothetical protein